MTAERATAASGEAEPDHQKLLGTEQKIRQNPADSR
jgi:hypothetical protein